MSRGISSPRTVSVFTSGRTASMRAPSLTLRPGLAGAPLTSTWPPARRAFMAEREICGIDEARKRSSLPEAASLDTVKLNACDIGCAGGQPVQGPAVHLGRGRARQAPGAYR